ncbi:MAG: DUF11 domain-containing protein [Theionarchaea archaeon]|nr:DUF11 domain-containing protein [Theionarchaea archaeon]
MVLYSSRLKIGLVTFVLLCSLLNNIGSQPVLTVNVAGDSTVNMCEQHDYTITVQNTSTTETATNVGVVATIPAGFQITNAGGGSVVGQTITWNAGDLGPSASWNVTITLEITCTAVSGQILVEASHDTGGPFQGSLYVSVQPGAVTITKTPTVIPAHLNDTVHWTLTVTSTGFGTIQNVVVSDTLGAGLQFDAVQSTPGDTSGLPTVVWDQTHIPALALMNPGDQVLIEVYAQVIACNGLNNYAQAEWSCNGAPCETETTQASVQLILEEPGISYVLPNFQLPYCSAGTQFTIPITNSGTGTAHNFWLYVDFDPLTVTVNAPGGAFYDAVNDRFFVGDIPAGSTVNLVFTLTNADWCQNRPSGTLLFQPEYYDDCGEVFYPPIQFGSLSVVGATSLSATKSGPYEAYLGEQVTYTLSVTYTGDPVCVQNSSNITIVDTIPNGFTVVNSGGGAIIGTTIQWTILPTATPWSTNIVLQVPSYAQCELYCYTSAVNTLDATVTDCCGCVLTASATASTYLECEQLVDSEKTVASVPGNWEKCTELTYTNTYVFADNALLDTESWNSMVFYEEMANNQEYVSTQPVTITDNNNPLNTCSINITPTVVGGELVYDFSGYDFSGCPPIRNSTLVIEYNLRTTDTSQPDCASTFTFYDWSRLYTGWPDFGQCMPDSVIQEGETITIYQSDMDISISGLPIMIDVCGTYTVTITLTNTQAAVDAYDVVVFFPTTNYEIDLGSVVYTGVIPNSGPTLTAVPSQGYLWDYGDNFTAGTSGTITFDITKRCAPGCACGATVYFDDLCNDDDSPDISDPVCTESVSLTPFVLQASIFIKKVPELIYATTNQVTWKIYTTNSGSGTAYNVWVDDVLGSDLQYNSSFAEDLLGNPVAVTTNPNQDHNGGVINGVSWIFDSIPAGATRVITLTADLIGCVNLDNDVSSSWGCLGTDCQLPVTDHSTVAIPPANAVTTNILPADIDLCEQDTVTVQVKNAGLTTVYDAEVEVTLPPGLYYVAGTGNPAEPQDPSANPVVWTKTEVPALASIDPGVVISISFDVITDCGYPSGNRTVVSRVYYYSVCWELKISPESRSVLPVREPDIDIEKDGRNVTQGQVTYTETVNAEPGDLVEWRIRISNTGSATAFNVEFWDVFPTNMTFSSIAPAPPGGGSGTVGDPWVHGNLLVGQTTTYLVQATVDVNECTDPPATNTACVQYGCDDNPTTPAVDPCRLPQVCDTARLRTTSQFTISQTLGTITTCDGEITVTIYNRGPTAYNVVVTSFLPAGFVYDSMVSGPNPTPLPPVDLTQPVWVLGNILEGQTVVLQFRITDDGINCDVVVPDTNTVHVDFDNACNQHYTRTHSVNVTPLKPILGVSKTPNTVTRPPGGNITWTITVTNTGNYQAENVEVVDDLSLNFINIVANNGSGGEVPSIVGNTVTWNLANPIPIGGTWTATLSADITGALGIDTVTVNGYCSTGCVYSTATDTAYVQTVEGLFKSPNLQTATIGEEVTFTVSVSYWGTSNYQNVQIIDTLPAGLQYVLSTYTDTLGLSPVPVVVGQSITWTLGNFAGPNTVDITVTARVQDIPANVNGVILTNWARTIGAEEGIPFDLSDSGDVQIIEPSLTIDKQGSITEGLPGTTIHYTITVQNTGTSPAYDVDIQDVVPAGLILDTGSITSTPLADTTFVVGNIITWEYIIIPVGGTVILEYDAVIPPEGGVFTNTATITEYSTLLGVSVYERVYPPISDQWTVRAPGTDIVKITLNTAVNIPSPGGIVYFELTITNTGDMRLDPVQLIDIVPDGLTYRPGTSIVSGIPYEPDSIVDNPDGTQTLTWLNIGGMDPGDTIIVTFEVEVDPGRVGTFVNRAIVIGTSVIGDVSDEDDSPVGVAAPAITITKSVFPSTVRPGNQVLFTLVITNTGEVPLDPVQVVDNLPVGLTYADAASILPDSVIVNPDSTTTVTWLNVGPLDIGENTTITFAAIFNGKESPARNVATATGTPPNGFPVSDDDFALVTVPLGILRQPPVSLQPLAYHGKMECYDRFKHYLERIREAHPEIEWKREVPCCEALEDLVDQLIKLILKDGLDKEYPEEWARVQELLPYVERCCKDIDQYYEAGNYVASNYWSKKRDEAYDELISLLLEILGL